MINIDTRTAAQHRFERRTKMVLRGCLYATSAIILYFVFSMGL